MARFEQPEHITTKAEAVKVEREKKQKIKTIKPEEKRKYIVYTVLGLLSLVIVGYAVNDFTSDEDTKAVQEIGTPEAEAEKYNTKLQAIEQGEKPIATTTSLEDAYKKTANPGEEENNEAAKKLKEQLKEMESEEKNGSTQKTVSNPQNSSTSKNKSSSGGSRHSGGSAPTYRSYPKQQPTTYSAHEVKPEEKQVADAEPKKLTKIKSTTGFFSKGEKSDEESGVITDKAIYGCIHTNQTIQDGSRVKIRLTRTATIEGNVYPINTIIYGMASIKPNRLMINVTTINQNPTKLEIYDAEDSNPGIYVLTPNLNTELKKELKTETLADEDLKKIPFSKTLTSFFKKKVKQERIELLNNYKLIIKIKKDNEY